VASEGDAWSNTALLFSSQKEITEFFSNSKLVFETLKFEFEEYEDLDSCITLRRNNEGVINGVEIIHEYCGEVYILEMSEGFVISSKKQNKLNIFKVKNISVI
jgi:uncharacterized protein YuzE